MSFVRRLVLILTVVVALGVPRLAFAHGYIVRSIPEDRATLERAPVRVQYWFSEALEPAYSAITVRDSEGSVISTGGVDPTDTSLLSARLPTNLPDGAYIAELRVAFASDGHVVVESRVFFVGDAVAGINGVAASDSVVPLEVVWRAMVLASLILLFGAFTLYSGVLVPAWGNRQFRAGLLPPRVMHRLNGIVVVGLIAALVGNVLALLQQTMVFFGADLSRVLGQGLWSVVRIGTRFGDVWSARMVLLGLVAVLFGIGLYVREREPDMVRPFWSANAWLMALILATLSVGSHAAGNLLWPWIGILMDWLHTLAVGFWAGGLAALVLVLPVAVGPYHGDARRQALLAALRRFSTLAAASVFVVVTTGIYSATTWIRTTGQVNSAYGGALAVKLLLVGLLLAVGAVHHAALRPERYARLQAVMDRASGFIPTLRLEALLALLVLVSVDVLSATPPPQPLLTQTTTPPPAAQTLDGLTVSASVTPGGTGVNSYDVVLTRDGVPVEDADVRLQWVDPSLDQRGGWHAAEPAGDGLYVATGDDIDRTGDWWLLIEVGGAQRFAFDWNIVPDTSAAQASSPNAVNVLALAAVLTALVYAVRQRLTRFYRRLDLRPATVTVALVALLVMVGILVGTALSIQSSEAQYEAAANPTPQVVNPALPDVESLAHGAQVYETACAAWSAQPNEVQNLARRMPDLRDEALYTLIESGWRALPACQAGLSEAQRWDLVNYLRSLETPRTVSGPPASQSSEDY